MKKGEKKKQEKRLKRRTQSKLARKGAHTTGPRAVSYYVRQARSYPIEGCLGSGGMG